ncbi:MAG: hypothetical protein IJF37_08745 [Lachnospiraceae bacterium]|nr:hypothetical protein [Lachnospiraceae bacterium]
MAIVKKYDPNQIYISDRLKNRLETIFNYPVTIVETPTGYGKTTVVKEFLKESGHKYIWFNVDNEDKEQFMADFCAKISGISENVANNLRNIGYPVDATTSGRIANAIMELEFREPTILVIDNYQFISDEHMNNVIKDLSGKKHENLVIVCLTQVITSSVTFDLVLRKKLNYLSKSDFELNKSEIIEYYKKCGVKLEDEESEFLCQYTEGWMSALYLQILSYVKTNSFEHTVSIDNLVSKAIWENLNRREQDFLISMSVFSDFTVRQATVMSENIMTDEERAALLENNGFIKYESKHRKYYIHSILKYFLDNEFEKLEPMFKKKIYKNAGEWYAANDNSYMAMTFFLKIDDYESIMAMDWSKAKFREKISKNNKNIFMDIVSHTPYDIKRKYIKNYLVFVFCLFLLNERAYFKKECDFVKDYIENNNDISDTERNEILGELELIYALVYYNDMKKMNACYKKSFEYMGKPTKIFKSDITLNFDCPSVLSMYHRKHGKLEDEIVQIDELMPNYYKITEGNSKGMEAIFKAEVLFNQGNLGDADILCEKTKYMAESRKQISIYICALFIQSRITLINADYEKLNKYLDEMKSIIERENRFNLCKMVDMCQSFIHANLEQTDQIPVWIKDNGSIEDNTSILNLGYANIIYGRFLLINGDYNKLMAISGQMLDIAGIFSNVMYKIYTYIYIAIAKYNTKKPEKAVEFLTEAVKLAYEDYIVMPFVELNGDIEQIIDKVNVAENAVKYREFINLLKNITKKYTKGLTTVKKASKNDQSYGLTKRELEVAKLAAQRMTNKEIADMLFIAESTVKSNLKIIFNKLEINSRSELKNFFN